MAGPVGNSSDKFKPSDFEKSFSAQERVLHCKTLNPSEQGQLRTVLEVCTPVLQDKIITLFSCEAVLKKFSNLHDKKLSACMRELEKMREDHQETIHITESLIVSLRNLRAFLKEVQFENVLNEEVCTIIDEYLSEIREKFHELITADVSIKEECPSWGDIELTLLSTHLPPGWGQISQLVGAEDVVEEEALARELRSFETKVHNPQLVEGKKFCEVDAACVTYSAEFEDGHQRRAPIYFHAAILGPATIKPYLADPKPQQLKDEQKRQMESLVSGEIDSLKDFFIETYDNGCNCLAFGVACVCKKVAILPGALQLSKLELAKPRETTSDPRVTESLAWMIDHHLTSQGCVKISDIRFIPDIDLIKMQNRRPYYLIAVIHNGHDDAHVMRACHLSFSKKLVWMQSGGNNKLCFAPNASGGIIEGFPEDPSLGLVQCIFLKHPRVDS